MTPGNPASRNEKPTTLSSCPESARIQRPASRRTIPPALLALLLTAIPCTLASAQPPKPLQLELTGLWTGTLTLAGNTYHVQANITPSPNGAYQAAAFLAHRLNAQQQRLLNDRKAPRPNSFNPLALALRQTWSIAQQPDGSVQVLVTTSNPIPLARKQPPWTQPQLSLQPIITPNALQALSSMTPLANQPPQAPAPPHSAALLQLTKATSPPHPPANADAPAPPPPLLDDQHQPIPNARVVRLKCLSAPHFHYRIRLPARFDPTQPPTVLLYFSPDGNAQPIAHEACDQLGWISIGLEESRNGPLEPIALNRDAALFDLQLRLGRPLQHILFAGFSGGARASANAAENYPDQTAGILLIGAGYLNNRPPIHIPAYFLIGESDENLPEINTLVAEERRLRRTLHLQTIPGGHIPGSPQHHNAGILWLAQHLPDSPRANQPAPDPPPRTPSRRVRTPRPR